MLALTGCTGMKSVSSEDPLYVGSAVRFVDNNAARKKLTPMIKGVLKPKPNNKFLWMRPALARNNMLSEKAKKKKFWKNKISDPVLLSQTKPGQVSAAIQNRVFHNGYFHNTVEFDTLSAGHKKAKHIYTITLHEPYRFDSIVFPKPENSLTKIIGDSQNESLLKKGDIYSLESAKNERVRIDRNLKENGYIYFNPEFISLKADTTTGDHKINAELTVKPETPPESRIPYTLRKIFIHDDHVLEDQSADTVAFGNYYLISHDKALNFNALQRGIFLKPGELYSRSNYIQSIRYMNELPIIRNANMKFAPSGNTDKLDAILYLSQRKRYAYSAEFNTIFRSTNYFGPGVIFSYTDRNVNKGAEILKINLRGRFEMQIAEGKANPAYELGLEANYTLPRLYPGSLLNFGKKSLPKTNISAGYNLFNRLDLYRMNSVFANFGYRWRKTDRVTHSLNPVEVIFTTIPESSKSEAFNEYLQENPGVQRSFDEQFIVGSAYEFTYEAQKGSRNEFFFRGGIDLAGNLLHAAYSVASASKDSLGRYKLAGVPFSQYVRTRIDLRYSFDFNGKSRIATR
ncbi:MAG: hypothetical protein OEV74_04275, partial [Cyclobacteriaceae bacterium]|nr:hypothetical protein [Cyclobacteriaceae bacterium]